MQYAIFPILNWHIKFMCIVKIRDFICRKVFSIFVTCVKHSYLKKIAFMHYKSYTFIARSPDKVNNKKYKFIEFSKVYRLLLVSVPREP